MDDGTATKHVNPADVLLEAFLERTRKEREEEENARHQKEFESLSNLKKDMVRRKIKKLIKRNRRKHV